MEKILFREELSQVSKKQMNLGLFMMGTGHHIASWRLPSVPRNAAENFEFFHEIASIAEKGKLDMLFFSDGLAFDKHSHPAELVRFDPLTLIAALSVTTKNIGLVATATTTYNEPFHIARKLLSTDHLNGGRTGWNVVTSYYQTEASNFSMKNHLDHSVRYQRAGEFVEIVKGLWDSWEDGAIRSDKESGKYFDENKLHSLNYEGKYFSVKGPLNSSRSPQERPIIVQAGSSDAGINLASRTADVIFTAQQTLKEAQSFYRKVKDRVVEVGRSSDDVKIMPGISIYVAETEQEAEAKFNSMQDLITPEVGLQILSEYLGNYDLSSYPLDGPLPDNIPETNGNKSRRELLMNLAKRENMTIRDIAKYVAGSRGHRTIIGNPIQIADDMQKWFENGAADGFNLMLPSYPESLIDFVDLVVPELQRRGIFRKVYQGETLRENLDLKSPVNVYEKTL
jgi:FMN-dependent oxidoreductase (nitrilotriacetate monooxygenase family)